MHIVEYIILNCYNNFKYPTLPSRAGAADVRGGVTFGGEPIFGDSKNNNNFFLFYHLNILA